MTVYVIVDPAVGGGLLLADLGQELRTFARLLGLPRQQIDAPGTDVERFVLSSSQVAAASGSGAQLLDWDEAWWFLVCKSTGMGFDLPMIQELLYGADRHSPSRHRPAAGRPARRATHS